MTQEGQHKSQSLKKEHLGRSFECFSPLVLIYQRIKIIFVYLTKQLAELFKKKKKSILCLYIQYKVPFLATSPQAIYALPLILSLSYPWASSS